MVVKDNSIGLDGMTFTVGLDISGLDESFKAHAARGIGRYVRELHREFSSGRVGSGVVRVVPFDHRSLRTNGNSWVRALSRTVECMPLGKTTLRQQVLFPFQLNGARVTSSPTGPSERLDVVHFPAHMDAPAWGLRGYILTVLDLIPLVCAELYKANRMGPRYHFARWLELQAIKNAAVILAISESTARDVERLLHIPRDRIVVTPLGVDERFFGVIRGVDAGVRSRLGLDGKYDGRPVILYVGGIDPRKNWRGLIDVLVRAKEILRERGASKLPVLVMCGKIADDREYPRLQAYIAERGVGSDVVMPGFVSDADLFKLYAISTAFLFPSYYEGFGLPPLEALAAGVPVISSNTSAMPEVLGTSALMASPDDVGAMSAHLVHLIEHPERREELSDLGRRRARLFTWSKTAALTYAAYERCADLKGVRLGANAA